MDEQNRQTALLEDIKDMLMGLAIMAAALVFVLLLGGLLGVLAVWIGVIAAIAGLGCVWQGWRAHRHDQAVH